MNSELLGKIITGLISAIVTLIVCLINNYNQRKRDEQTRKAEKEANEIKRKQELEDLEIKRKTDNEEQLKKVLEDMKKNSEDTKDFYIKEITEVKHTLDTQNKLFSLQLNTLTEEVRKHNNFATRVPALEAKMDIVTKNLGI